MCTKEGCGYEVWYVLKRCVAMRGVVCTKEGCACEV